MEDAAVEEEDELLEATSAWLAVAVARQRRVGSLVAIRAKRRASIILFFLGILNFCGEEDEQ